MAFSNNCLFLYILHIYLCIIILLNTYSNNLYFMILEHLTSNSNAYVNFILYGCSEYLLNLMFIRNCLALSRKDDFYNLLCLNIYFCIHFNVFFFFMTLKLYISYILVPFFGLYFYRIYSKAKKVQIYLYLLGSPPLKSTNSPMLKFYQLFGFNIFIFRNFFFFCLNYVIYFLIF